MPRKYRTSGSENESKVSRRIIKFAYYRDGDQNKRIACQNGLKLDSYLLCRAMQFPDMTYHHV